MSDHSLFSAIKPPIIVDDEETRRVVEIARAAAGGRTVNFDMLAWAWPKKGTPPEAYDFGSILSAILPPPPLSKDEERAIVAEARAVARARRNSAWEMLLDCPVIPIGVSDDGFFYCSLEDPSSRWTVSFMPDTTCRTVSSKSLRLLSVIPGFMRGRTTSSTFSGVTPLLASISVMTPRKIVFCIAIVLIIALLASSTTHSLPSAFPQPFDESRSEGKP